MQIRAFENRAFLIVVALVTVAFVWVVRGFLMPVFWAAVLAVLFRPVFRGWLRALRGHHPNVAAALTVVTTVIMLIVPLALLGTAVTQEAIGVYEQVASGEIDLQAPVAWLEQQVPAFGRRVQGLGVEAERVQEGLANAAAAVGQFAAEQALTVGQNALALALYIGVMLYFLFFFIRDGERLLDLLVRALPLGDRRERRMFERFADVSRATVKGTLIVAAIQGTVGGLTFWALGIDSAVFWGVVMGVLSLLPAVGTFLVWGPTAVILFATGSPVRAVVLIAVGALGIGLIDNFLRPILVGRDARMPDYLVLLATLGGIAAFGLSGFVIGPMVAAFFLVVWEMFIESFAELDDPDAPERAEPDPDHPGAAQLPADAVPQTVPLSDADVAAKDVPA